MTHNGPKLEKYLFPGFSGCIFAPGTRGPGERVNSLFWIELKNTYIRMVDDTSSGSLLPSKANLT